MNQVKLIHWKAHEIKERENILKSAGYQVDSDLSGGAGLIKALASDPPDAIVIDLSRLPSQGRDFALLVRKRKSIRNIPIVFVEGDPEKISKIKELLPDAWYTTWREISEKLKHAIDHSPTDPIVPDSAFAGYAGKPLVEKLGIKSDMTVAVINQPPDFYRNLDPIPPGVKIISGKSKLCDLTIWFCRSTGELEAQITDIVGQSSYGPVWIAWPKQKSALASDITQQAVRQTGLDHGLVDYKISSFDATWSGLLFKYRGST